MLTLLLDETGRGVGRGDATNVPGYVPGPNEVECTTEQFHDPTAWARVGGVLVPAAAVPATASELLAYAKSVRYASETAGTVTSLGPISTDDRSKILILGSLMAAQVDPSWSTPWQFADGTTATVDRAGILEISGAAQAHVNAAFAVFGAVQRGIAASPPTITTRAAIDAAFAALGG